MLRAESNYSEPSFISVNNLLIFLCINYSLYIPTVVCIDMTNITKKHTAKHIKSFFFHETRERKKNCYVQAQQ